MKYCRYCTYCICGDWYYCTLLNKELRRVDRAVNCDSFELSEMGDVDTGKQYKPQNRIKEKDLPFEQLRFYNKSTQ